MFEGLFSRPALRKRSQTSQQHRGPLPFGDERIHGRRGTSRHVDLSRQHEDGNLRMRAPDLAGYHISVHIPHAVVQDHNSHGMPFEEPQPDPAVAGRDHVVPGSL